MNYSETPENDDFRDREFDCFLEKKKVTGREGSKKSILEGEINRETFDDVYSYIQHSHALFLHIVIHMNYHIITLVCTQSHTADLSCLTIICLTPGLIVL